ncbi:hypothetical protein VSDG_07160 [Cytospora chrysosperma]|uniref:Uncharacterized protein n=1 Tax=Cytospora chrysosperma TaxID=252740 RepID=A0A423VKB1_CYTCH|nr:hypothetical protein VSDG_07160 [Valsa sordida]
MRLQNSLMLSGLVAATDASAIFDPNSNATFPLNITDSSTFTTENPGPLLYPVAAENLSYATAEALVSTAMPTFVSRSSGGETGSVSFYLPDAIMALCQATGFSSDPTCHTTYEATSFAAIWTQLLAKAEFSGLVANISVPRWNQLWDYSGIFSCLIDELQKAKGTGQRAYIIGHVPSGWYGSNLLPDGADYSHQDQAFIYYIDNGTNQSAENAVANTWVGSSLTPLMILDSGYRMYEIETESFEVLETYAFYSDVSSPPHPQSTSEYSNRTTYGPGADWAGGEPPNATFWHRVTEAIEADRSL